jgi:hypothetical protein
MKSRTSWVGREKEKVQKSKKVKKCRCGHLNVEERVQLDLRVGVGSREALHDSPKQPKDQPRDSRYDLREVTAAKEAPVAKGHPAKKNEIRNGKIVSQHKGGILREAAS